MKQSKYMTTPLQTDKMPPAIPYILANETAERFAFYGVKLILTVYLTNYLFNLAGQKAELSKEAVVYWASLFSSLCYFLPFFGAILSDAFFGKFKIIIPFSVLYCFGFLALVLDQSYIGTATGLFLVAMGTGIIKPAVTANVGDQFGKLNQHLISRVYGWFYFVINLGAFVTSLSAPLLLEKFGPRVAFGVTGIFMIMAVITYWVGRRQMVHRPAAGIGFLREALSGEGLKALGKLSVVFLLVSIFWSLFDQTTTTWVQQAEKMNRIIFGYEILASQPQAANPALVMIMIPLFTYLVYPAMGKLFKVTSLRKIGIGFIIAAFSFVICAWVETQIQKGLAPHIIWQFVAYIFMTAAEVMVSITVIEFSYTQAPPKMKSLLASISLLPVSFGNMFTAGVNKFIENPDKTSKLPGASYFWFFTAAMVVTTVIFVIVAAFYREKTYLEDHPEQPE